MYHFLKEDRKLQFSPYTPVVLEETLVYPGKPKLCEAGFHASERIIDALQYAPGPVLCVVELGGEIIHGEDKAVAQERTVSWMQDISPTLHEFACQVAEEALEKHGVTDKRSWKAIEVKRLWLKGEATDKELRVAQDAAWSAADAAGSAAWYAASAAESAAEAAWSAAWYAARSAAEAAAWSAADAAWSAAYTARSAAYTAYAASARSAAYAAWSAACAAWSAQNEKLEAMIKDL